MMDGYSDEALAANDANGHRLLPKVRKERGVNRLA